MSNKWSKHLFSLSLFSTLFFSSFSAQAYDGSDYTLQLMSANNVSTATEFIETHHLQGQAKYYEVQQNGTSWYVVLYGKYPTKEAAMQAKNDLPSDLQMYRPWVRTYLGVAQAPSKKMPSVIQATAPEVLAAQAKAKLQAQQNPANTQSNEMTSAEFSNTPQLSNQQEKLAMMPRPGEGGGMAAAPNDHANIQAQLSQQEKLAEETSEAVLTTVNHKEVYQPKKRTVISNDQYKSEAVQAEQVGAEALATVGNKEIPYYEANYNWQPWGWFGNSSWNPRYTFFGMGGTRGEGVGSGGRGIAGLDVLLPFVGNDQNMLFGDGRIEFQTQSIDEANLGLGYRHIINPNQLFGIYAFHDWQRSTGDFNFKQLSMGAEILGTTWDFRGNGYLPYDRQIVKTEGPNAFLTGHKIVITDNTEIGTALRGFDLEVGRTIDFLPGFRLYGGIYHYGWGSDPVSFTGPMGRIEWAFNPVVTLTVSDTYDKERENTFLVGLRLNFNAAKANDPTIASRMEHFIVRDPEIVSVREHTLDQFISPENVYFVNDLNPVFGDGTFENPFQNINAAFFAAANDGNVGDIIYVYQGSGAGYPIAGEQVTLEPYETITGQGGNWYYHGFLMLPGSQPQAPYIYGRFNLNNFNLVENIVLSGQGTSQTTGLAGNFVVGDILRNMRVLDYHGADSVAAGVDGGSAVGVDIENSLGIIIEEFATATIHGGNGFDAPNDSNDGSNGGDATGILLVNDLAVANDVIVADVRGGRGGIGANGLDGADDAGGTGGAGTDGTNGGNGGFAQGMVLVNVLGGYGLSIHPDFNQLNVSNIIGGDAEHAGIGGNGGSGTDLNPQGDPVFGGDAGNGGNGGDAGSAVGISATSSIFSTQNNQITNIFGGAAGFGAAGGNGGGASTTQATDNNAASVAGNGGSGGDGGNGADAVGLSFINSKITIQQTSITNVFGSVGNLAGNGGIGGDANTTGISNGQGRYNGGLGGNGGNAGAGGDGGDAIGFNIIGGTTFANAMNISSILGGVGSNSGAGGTGGEAGSFNSVTLGQAGTGGDGGNGNSAGDGGSAFGVLAITADLDLSQSAMSNILGGDGGHAGLAGGGGGGDTLVSGNLSKGNVGFGAISDAGSGGAGGHGGDGGNAEGVFALLGAANHVNLSQDSIQTVIAGTGGDASNGGSGGTGDAIGNNSARKNIPFSDDIPRGYPSANGGDGGAGGDGGDGGLAVGADLQGVLGATGNISNTSINNINGGAGGLAGNGGIGGSSDVIDNFVYEFAGVAIPATAQLGGLGGAGGMGGEGGDSFGINKSGIALTVNQTSINNVLAGTGAAGGIGGLGGSANAMNNFSCTLFVGTCTSPLAANQPGTAGVGGAGGAGGLGGNASGIQDPGGSLTVTNSQIADVTAGAGGNGGLGGIGGDANSGDALISGSGGAPSAVSVSFFGADGGAGGAGGAAGNATGIDVSFTDNVSIDQVAISNLQANNAGNGGAGGVSGNANMFFSPFSAVSKGASGLGGNGGVGGTGGSVLGIAIQGVGTESISINNTNIAGLTAGAAGNGGQGGNSGDANLGRSIVQFSGGGTSLITPITAGSNSIAGTGGNGGAGGEAEGIYLDNLAAANVANSKISDLTAGAGGAAGNGGNTGSVDALFPDANAKAVAGSTVLGGLGGNGGDGGLVAGIQILATPTLSLGSIDVNNLLGGNGAQAGLGGMGGNAGGSAWASGSIVQGSTAGNGGTGGIGGKGGNAQDFDFTGSASGLSSSSIQAGNGGNGQTGGSGGSATTGAIIGTNIDGTGGDGGTGGNGGAGGTATALSGTSLGTLGTAGVAGSANVGGVGGAGGAGGVGGIGGSQ